MVAIKIKTGQELKDMTKSGEILTQVLDKLCKLTKAGVTSQELDGVADEYTRSHGAVPAFLGYQGFPGRVCVSVNNEIVHALPNKRKLMTGDLVGIDYGVSYNGMITDAARTISIGRPSRDGKKLMAGCYEALEAAIALVRDGVMVGDISSTIEHSLKRHDLKAIYSLTGHGVGHQLHEDPVIANYGRAGTGEVLRAGMTIAIEPIASIGTHDLYLAQDGWTYMTRDGSLSAQFENTLLVTMDGCKVLAS